MGCTSNKQSTQIPAIQQVNIYQVPAKWRQSSEWNVHAVGVPSRPFFLKASIPSGHSSFSGSSSEVFVKKKSLVSNSKFTTGEQIKPQKPEPESDELVNGEANRDSVNLKSADQKPLVSRLEMSGRKKEAGKVETRSAISEGSEIEESMLMIQTPKHDNRLEPKKKLNYAKMMLAEAIQPESMFGGSSVLEKLKQDQIQELNRRAQDSLSGKVYYRSTITAG